MCVAAGRILTAAFLVGALLVTAAAAAPPAPRVRAELISEVGGVEPGGEFWVGLRQRIAPGWHTYWINPGDSGEPTAIEWTLPAGFRHGAIAWPHPARIPVGPVMSYGYTDEVVLLVALRAPPGLVPGSRVSLKAQASWLVCETICIPEEARLQLTLPVVASPPAPDPRGAPLVAKARRALPLPSPWAASFSDAGDVLVLRLRAPALAAAGAPDVWFYPDRWGVIDHAAPQDVAVDGDGIAVRVTRGSLPLEPAAAVEGVLVVRERLDQGTVSQSFVVRAAPESVPALQLGGSRDAVSLPRALLLALAGGLVLNLMPCVLPVLSVKILSLVQHAGALPRVLRGHGIAYTAGVLASFAVVAGALIALRATGDQLGWGFQLQSPLFVSLLAYVLFALALSLSGVIMLGGAVTGFGHGLAARPGYAGSFFTGALATVAATPCTAPFMGVAVGFALTQPAGTALLVFEALGLGLALPYLGLSLVPAWRRLLPKPGPWMERLKQFLAFPLYASVAWLVWVVSQQAGSEGVAAVLAGLVLVAFAAWLHQTSRVSGRRWRDAATAGVAVSALGAIALAGLGGALPVRAAKSGVEGVAWEPFSPKRLAQLRAEGSPVFVNFTAAWCITCLVNERVALRSPEVAEAFAREGVVSLKADWTNRDGAIAEVLGSFGRSGVPLYVVYPAARGGRRAGLEPTVLPQILSERILIEAVTH
jgi:thiol:disulfide interchange protein DsbD